MSAFHSTNVLQLPCLLKARLPQKPIVPNIHAITPRPTERDTANIPLKTARVRDVEVARRASLIERKRMRVEETTAGTTAVDNEFPCVSFAGGTVTAGVAADDAIRKCRGRFVGACVDRPQRLFRRYYGGGGCKSEDGDGENILHRGYRFLRFVQLLQT